MSYSTAVSSPVHNNNNGVVPETAIERVLFNGYLCSVLVIASQDLEVLKILRRLCKKSGLYEPGPERYWNRHCVTSMYRVTAEVTQEHRKLYYHDLYRGDLLRQETLPFGYGIVDLCVEMFDETGHITFRAYQNDTSYYEGMLSQPPLLLGVWRTGTERDSSPLPPTQTLSKQASKKRKTAADKTSEQQEQPTPLPQTQLLSLATLRAQLLLENSVISSLFFESRLSNLLSWLAKFKTRYAFVERALAALRSKATPTTTTGRGGGGSSQPSAAAQTPNNSRDDDINQSERRFYEIIMQRIVTLAERIRREVIDMGGVLQLAKLPRDDPYESVRRAAAERQKRSATKVASEFDKEVDLYKQRLLQKFVAAIDDLQNMIGLTQLKNDVARYLISSIMQLDDYRMFQDHINILLFGQPGVGKTASAQKISNLLRLVGLVADDEPSSFLSHSRAELVAQFEGQTASKTRQAFAFSYGTVLFIDEFYQLVSRVGEDSSGQESLDTIVKLSEDFKGEVFIIGAGYEDAIRKRVFASNEGVASRFPNKWRLPNYSARQLARIARLPEGDATSSSSQDDDDDDYTSAQLLPSGLMFRGVDVGDNFDQDVNRVLTELIGRAWESDLFENENARGARNLMTAIREQKAVRIYGTLLNRSTSDSTTSLTTSTTAPYDVTDVYRGFATWVKSTKNLSVYYIDKRVEQLVS